MSNIKTSYSCSYSKNYQNILLNQINYYIKYQLRMIQTSINLRTSIINQFGWNEFDTQKSKPSHRSTKSNNGQSLDSESLFSH